MARESRKWPSVVCPVCVKEFRPYKHPHRRTCCSDGCRAVLERRKHVREVVLSPTDAAYVAGIIDGEGSIGLWMERHLANRSGKRWNAKITIAQSNREFLEGLRATLQNGTIRLNKGTALLHPNSRTGWKLEFGAYQLRWLLPQFVPYLRLKQRQAGIVLRYLELAGRGRREIANYIPELYALHEECKRLNRRGIQLASP